MSTAVIFHPPSSRRPTTLNAGDQPPAEPQIKESPDSPGRFISRNETAARRMVIDLVSQETRQVRPRPDVRKDRGRLDQAIAPRCIAPVPSDTVEACHRWWSAGYERGAAEPLRRIRPCRRGLGIRIQPEPGHVDCVRAVRLWPIEPPQVDRHYAVWPRTGSVRAPGRLRLAPPTGTVRR